MSVYRVDQIQHRFRVWIKSDMQISVLGLVEGNDTARDGGALLNHLEAVLLVHAIP